MAMRSEFRVVAERHGFTVTPEVQLAGPVATKEDARLALEGVDPVGFDVTYKNLRIQQRVVTDWMNLATEEAAHA